MNAEPLSKQEQESEHTKNGEFELVRTGPCRFEMCGFIIGEKKLYLNQYQSIRLFTDGHIPLSFRVIHHDMKPHLVVPPDQIRVNGSSVH
jgi:hypothetical protein